MLTSSGRAVPFLLVSLTLLSLGWGCNASESAQETSPEDDSAQQVALAAPAGSFISVGKHAYETYCLGCHGREGDGNGPAARFLSPRPRNFQIANFKFSSTRSGRLPRDEDLKRTIRTGLKGTAMPPWELLPERTIDALIVYIKAFSAKWTKRRTAPVVPIVNDPYRSAEDKSDAIARGELVYHGYATCWTCHPAYVSTDKINVHLSAMENPTRDAFRDNLQRSDGKPNSEGEMVFPPDFHRDFVRAGITVDDLYRSIATGITGTAMPTWVDSMDVPSAHDKNSPLVKPEDLWAVAYYIESLIHERPARFAEGGFEIRERPQTIYKPGELPPPVIETEAAEAEEFLDEEEFLEEDEE